MKINTIIGARPQFIKAAVVSRSLRESYPDIQEMLIHTGQHYDQNMSEIFFNELDIPRPKHNLGIGGGTHGQNTGRMIEEIEKILLIERPDLVLVYGDTDSTLAGSLAAVKMNIPVAHVEAGLRSFNRRMPEEINRVLTDHISDLLFAPTEQARTNLIEEGIADDKICVVGDVMYDAALFYKPRAVKPTWFDLQGVAVKEYVLCTIHRAENTDERDRMHGILQGLEGAGLPVILPLHPRTRIKLQQMGLNLPTNVNAVEPVGYLEMIWLEANCKLVATDSGGVQKEAYFHKVPCVTLRDETEWVELVEVGANRLTGSDAARIASGIIEASYTDGGISWGNLYGDGNAAHKTASTLAVGKAIKTSSL